jgi:glycosyltransferase involved in cell wall biosynthesis
VRVHAPGPPGHGVVRHARAVASLVGEAGPDLVHAHFTDALYGPDIATAAEAFAGWAADAGRPLVVTLHDVPGADPDPARDARRAAGYRRVIARADAVVVSSRHEAERVLRVAGVVARVIPLPLPRAAEPSAPPPWAGEDSLVVVGFVYPGKGHELALDLAADRGLRVVAAGAVSPGHRAPAGLLVTGPLSDAGLAAAIRAATVPFVANPGVSASGSLLAWLAHGRRPVVAAGPYADEVAADTGAFVPARDLDAAVDRAVRDPASTWLDAEVRWPDVGAAHRALYQDLRAC